MTCIHLTVMGTPGATLRGRRGHARRRARRSREAVCLPESPSSHYLFHRPSAVLGRHLKYPYDTTYTLVLDQQGKSRLLCRMLEYLIAPANSVDEGVFNTNRGTDVAGLCRGMMRNEHDVAVIIHVHTHVRMRAHTCPHAYTHTHTSISMIPY